MEIDSLQIVIDDMTGDANTVVNLNNAIAERDDLESTRNDAFLIGNPFPLDTSVSCPEALTCISSEALYFVTSNTFFDFEIFILNDQSDFILDTAGIPINDLPGVNDFKYQEITIDNYTGPITLFITKYDSEGILGYSIDGYAY